VDSDQSRPAFSLAHCGSDRVARRRALGRLMDTNGARPGWSLSFRVPRSAKRPERNHDGHELVSRPNVWWTPRRRGGRVVERAPSSSGDTGGSQHTLVLTPANAEARDTLVSGITGAHQPGAIRAGRRLHEQEHDPARRPRGLRRRAHRGGGPHRGELSSRGAAPMGWAWCSTPSAKGTAVS
jgi:hypothetical protein